MYIGKPSPWNAVSTLYVLHAGSFELLRRFAEEKNSALLKNIILFDKGQGFPASGCM